jgi:hypothetical protein
MNNPDILLVKNKDIDYSKWDQCIASSTIPLVYAQSWYLDIIASDWDALICGDYEYVMPLTAKKKFGLSFLLQPVYAQQHGIFPKADNVLQNKFLSTVYEKFRYVAVNLNASHSEPFPDGFAVHTRENFILQLILPYQELKNNYSKHTRRQIKKAEDSKVFIVKGIQSKEYLDLKASARKIKLPQPTLQTLKRLIEFGHIQGNGAIYAAYNRDNMLCAAAFFLFAGHRVTYLNAFSTDEGKKISAMHKIVDHFIQEHAGSLLTLDFEGSVIPGVARFYEGFGSATERYYFLKSNRLPIPIRWFKK